jgi:hypothetical protein
MAARNGAGVRSEHFEPMDEAQLEVRKEMIEWIRFAGKEECEAFKPDDGKEWSEPVHNERGWYRGYCRAGELATIAVREAGQYYSLNTELSAGYIIGRNWAECH